MRHVLLFLGSSLLCFAATPLVAQQGPTTTGSGTWDLERTYPDAASWERDRRALLAGLERLRTMESRRIASAQDLAETMEIMRETRGLAGKMARFGLLTSNLDTSSEAARARYDAGTALEAQTEAVATLLDHRIRTLGQQTVRAWQKSEPRLRAFGIARRIDRIFHEAPHSPPPAVQGLVAAMERWPRTTADAYETLVHRTIEWPRVPMPGAVSDPLSPNVYRTVRRNRDASVRQAAATAFRGSLENYEQLMGLLFTRRLEADIAIAKARGFTDHMDASLVLRDGFPAGTGKIAVEAARRHQHLSRKYARLVARAFGKPRGDYSDLLARSPWPFTGTFSMPQAIDTIVRSQSHFGPEHAQAARAVFNSNLVHLEPGPNKSGLLGAFIQVGGGRPYAIASFDGSLDSTRGLAMLTQSMLLNMTIPADGWPDRREDDQPIFGNSRWTLGQVLLDEQLQRDAKNPRERAAALMDQLSRMWTEFFYRVGMVELERWATDEIARGAPPTGPQISARYLAIFRDVNASADGGVSISEAYAREWITEPTLFLGNHQLGFLQSYVATIATAEALKRADPRMTANFRTVRGRDLEYSYDILRRTGIDLASAAPYDAYAQFMNAKMDELDRELSAMNL